MPDKNLTTPEWKKFAKGRDLEDAALSDAFAALARCKPADPQAQLTALEEIERQVDLLLKTHRADKPVATRLGEIGEALATEREAALQAVLDAQMPAMLGPDMAKLMKQVEGGATLKVMIARAGSEMLVLASRKSVGTPQRRMLATRLAASGSLKVMIGEVVFVEPAYTFVLAKASNDLAKRIKAALLAQTGKRYKVAVRAAAG